MTLKPNLSTRLGSEFKQQSRKVNSYHRLEPLLLFFCPLILHELSIKSLFFFLITLQNILIDSCPLHHIHCFYDTVLWENFSILLSWNLPFSTPSFMMVVGQWKCSAWELHHKAETRVRWREMCWSSHYLNKTTFQHIINVVFRLLFMAHSCQSGFKHTTQTHSVTCTHTVLCCEEKRGKVQRLKVQSSLIDFLEWKAIIQRAEAFCVWHMILIISNML